MALRSRHFRSNARLQSCLTSDAAHVTPGERGEHVALIQTALMRLGVPGIDDAEARAKSYGRTTATAVLIFKRDLDIINRSYQQQADNIVGKMTIERLDRQIWILEGLDGPMRQPRPTAYHPPSPAPPVAAAGPVARGGTTSLRPAFAARQEPFVSQAESEGIGDFVPPLSTYPEDLQRTIARSNSVKTGGDLILYPFIANHLGPQSGADLSKAFADHPVEAKIVLDVHRRMRAFGTFALIKYIHNTFRGTGSRGFEITPFDHEAAMVFMTALTADRTKLGPLGPLRFSAFCRDAMNVHGPRDSFREIVNFGEGLHICITQPAARGTHRCDFHIDDIQQGQICANGWCVPILNDQTTDHLRSVAPWLVPYLVNKAAEWEKKQTDRVLGWGKQRADRFKGLGGRLLPW